MTRTINHADALSLEGDPRASMNSKIEQCGGGIHHPSRGVCENPAEWDIRTFSNAKHAHGYCTEHAALILRCVDYVRRGGAPPKWVREMAEEKIE